MAWNPKAEHVKHAVKIAKEKHPDGFNKGQLIQAGKEVFGGFTSDSLSPIPTKKIETQEDVNHMRNHMALIDGGYPLSITGCEVVGINGGCGFSCPVFKEGACDNISEFDPEEYKKDDEFEQDIYDSYWE